MENLKVSTQPNVKKIGRPLSTKSKNRQNSNYIYFDLIPHAVKFLSESFEINKSPNITVNNFLTSSLTRIVQDTKTDQDGNEYAHYTLECSKRLVDYYTFREQVEIIKYDLVCYAYSIMNLPLNKSQFESQVKMLGLNPIDSVEIRGNVHQYVCNHCLTTGVDTKLSLPYKLTIADMNCPVCNNHNVLSYTGSTIIGEKVKQDK